MTRRSNQPLPARAHGLLIVEGGDEREVCKATVGPAKWADLACWVASGRTDLPATAALARLDPNYHQVSSVGIVLDIEDSLPEALALATRTVVALGLASAAAHAAFTSTTPPVGVFLVPDGISPGCTETLCRAAVGDAKIAGCVDALVACAGVTHSTAARAAKGWLHAYLAALPEPITRFHVALNTAGGIDTNHSIFDPLRAFLSSL
jgi:hypothetical protein